MADDYYQPTTNNNTANPLPADNVPAQGASTPPAAPPGMPAEPPKMPDTPPPPPEVPDMPKPEPIAPDMPSVEPAPEEAAPQVTAPEFKPTADDAPIEAAKSAGNPEESYNAFIDQLIIQLGFDKIEEPQKSKLSEAIKQRVESRVLRTLMTSLTQEQSDKLDKQIQDENLAPEAIIKLLTEEAPNASDKIIQALDDLYQEMKEETDTLFQASAAKVANDQDSQAK